MSHYKATVHWQRSDGEKFNDNKYSRKHLWTFDNELDVPATASPHVVPLQFTESKAVDPEEAFVASLSSCHMLWFLSLAANKGYVVEDYKDIADGVLEKNQDRKLSMTKVTLQPVVVFSKDAAPNPEAFDELHHTAHEKCYIANSVNTKINIDATLKTS